MKGISCILLLAIASIDGRRSQSTNAADNGACCNPDSQYSQASAPADVSYQYQPSIKTRQHDYRNNLMARPQNRNPAETINEGPQTQNPQRINYDSYPQGASSSSQPTAQPFGLSSGTNEASEITNFSWNLFKNILNQGAGNVVVSPVISQFQLSILEKAAEGRTKLELQKITGGVSATNLNQILNSTDGSSVLQSANAIFFDSSLQVTISQHFGRYVSQLKTRIFALNFKSDAESSLREINSWAADQTRDTIKEIIPRQFPLQNVKMLLASAIYFQGVWKHKFNETQPDKFTNEDGQTVQVPFMEIKNNILIDKITENGIDVQVIEIPYEGGNYVMLLILPNDQRPNLINNIVGRIDSVFLSSIVQRISQNSPQRLTLSMPKFKISSTTPLRQILRNMQLIELFTNSASLPHLGPQLQVDEILHQGVLNVDENGTTAAAISTSFLIPLSADSVVNQKIVIDRPFLSLIYDKKNNIPLFISKISKL